MGNGTPWHPDQPIQCFDPRRAPHSRFVICALNGQLPDLLSQEFRACIRKVALVEDMLPNRLRRSRGRLLLGLFHSIPTTKKSTFDL